MSKLPQSELEKLARLAALELGSQELDSLSRDLEQILDYVHKLDALNTDSVEPLAQPAGTHARLREDDLRKQLTPEEILRSAPQVQEQMFRVPPVLEGES